MRKLLVAKPALSVLTAFGVVALLLAPAPAAAGTVKKWSVIDSGVSNTNRPGLQRVGNDLEVAWINGTSEVSLFRRQYTPGGGVGPTVTPLTGWDALSDDPVPLGTQTALAGLRGAPGDADYWAGAAFLVDAAGVIGGQLSESEYAYASQGQDATTVGGQPLAVFTAGGDIRLHVGVGPGPDVTVASGGCCTYYPAVAPTGSDAAWVAWYANSETVAQRGWQVRQITGLPGAPALGAQRQAPGSQTGGDAISPSQRAALTTRPDGSVWLAYPLGYPTAKRIRVWQVGTTTVRDVRTGTDVKHVALDSDAAGRLWLAWTDEDGAVRAMRSNPAATRWGGVNRVPSPTGDYLYSVAILPASDRVDVVSNTGDTLRHRQLLPAVLVEPSFGGVKKGMAKVTVRVTDAGAPLAGAAVTLKGIGTRSTKAGGKVTFTFPKKKRKRVAITARYTAFAPAATSLRLK